MSRGAIHGFTVLLQTRRDLLRVLRRRCRWHLPADTAGSAASLWTVLRPPFADGAYNHLAGVGADAVATWLLVVGRTGVFVRHVWCVRRSSIRI